MFGGVELIDELIEDVAGNFAVNYRLFTAILDVIDLVFVLRLIRNLGTWHIEHHFMSL